jgi:hypothetical protein
LGIGGAIAQDIDLTAPIYRVVIHLTTCFNLHHLLSPSSSLVRTGMITITRITHHGYYSEIQR